MVRLPGDESRDESGDDGLPDDGDLARFAATTRVGAAVRARSRERWLRQQVLESTTVAGACWSLAEAGRPLAVTTVGGRTHQGVVRSLGEDFVSLVVASGQEVLVPLAMVAVLVPGRDDMPTGRPVRPGTSLVEAVAHLAAERPQVAVWCSGADAPVVGELWGTSAEVAMIIPTHGERERVAYVRLSAVVELSVSASG
jgi:hypothetical protein